MMPRWFSSCGCRRPPPVRGLVWDNIHKEYSYYEGTGLASHRALNTRCPCPSYKADSHPADGGIPTNEGAGHWMGEETVEKALLEAMREFE